MFVGIQNLQEDFLLRIRVAEHIVDALQIRIALYDNVY